MEGFGKSWTGTGKGSGRRWRGADEPGGGGGMFAGSEGPERAVAGRYEGRQTRQVPSALFWHFFHSCRVQPSGAGRRWGSERQRRAPLGSACRHRRGRHRLGADRRCGWAATCPFLDTSYSKRTNAPERPTGDARAANLRQQKARSGRRRGLHFTAALGHYLPEHPCPHGIQTSLQHGMALGLKQPALPTGRPIILCSRAI